MQAHSGFVAVMVDEDLFLQVRFPPFVLWIMASLELNIQSCSYILGTSAKKLIRKSKCIRSASMCTCTARVKTFFEEASA